MYANKLIEYLTLKRKRNSKSKRKYQGQLYTNISL